MPERTFCAVPAASQPAAAVFGQRVVVKGAADEVQAHMGMFDPEKNSEYAAMSEEAAALVARWFTDESPVVDQPPELDAGKPLAGAEEEGRSEEEEEDIKVTDDGVDLSSLEKFSSTGAEPPAGRTADDDELPDESPIDVAAAASMVPLPADDEGMGEAQGDKSADGLPPTESEKQTYMRYLFHVAQEAGTNFRTMWPSRVPYADRIPMPPPVSMPAVSMPKMPGVGSFWKAGSGGEGAEAGAAQEKSSLEEAGVRDSEKAAYEERSAEKGVQTGQ